MSILKAAMQNMNPEALEATKEFMAARDEYSRACSLHAKIRLLADHPNASDEDILRYAKARKAFQLECKVYHAARSTWAQKIHFIKMAAPTLSNEEYLQLYGDTSGKALDAQFKLNQVLETVDPELLEQIKRTSDKTIRERFLEKVADEQAGISVDVMSGENVTENSEEVKAKTADIQTDEFSISFKKDKDPTDGDFEF